MPPAWRRIAAPEDNDTKKQSPVQISSRGPVAPEADIAQRAS